LLLCVKGPARVTALGPLDCLLARALARRPQFVVLDGSELTLLSSLAMGLLVRFHRDLARWGGRVKLAGIRPAVRESLESVRLANLFEFHATVADALASA
jgi:anti-anti-sigma factor